MTRLNMQVVRHDQVLYVALMLAGNYGRPYCEPIQDPKSGQSRAKIGDLGGFPWRRLGWSAPDAQRQGPRSRTPPGSVSTAPSVVPRLRLLPLPIVAWRAPPQHAARRSKRRLKIGRSECSGCSRQCKTPAKLREEENTRSLALTY